MADHTTNPTYTGTTGPATHSREPITTEGGAEGAEKGAKARGGIKGLMNKTEEIRQGINKFADESVTPEKRDAHKTEPAFTTTTTTATGAGTSSTHKSGGIMEKTEGLRQGINKFADETLTPGKPSGSHAADGTATHKQV